MSIDSTKVYFGYTPYIPKNFAEEWDMEASRATIAMRKDGNAILYGVSICSHNDNFNKKEGRTLAEERLNRSPQFIEIPENITNRTKTNAKGDVTPWDNHDICLYFLRNMINSLSHRDRIKRAQRRVSKVTTRKPTRVYLLKSSDLKKV